MNQRERSKSKEKQPERVEIRLSGSGGQGLILAGVILAEAAAIYDKKNAVQTQSYGPEARGGASKSDVIISNSEILYPKTIRLDYLLALNQVSCDQYSIDLRENGLLLVDKDAVDHLPALQIVSLPLIRTAREKVGKVMTTNIVALGALVALSGIVKRESIKKAVLARVPKGTENLNLKALKLGFEMADEIKKRLKDE